MADTYDAILGVLLQETGGNNNSWGTNANDFVFKILARAIAGTATHTDTSGTVNLDDVTPPAGLREDVDMIHNFTGTLVGDLTVEVPALSKVWIFRNNTSGSYFLYVKTNGGTAVQVPQGTTKILLCDGTNVKRLDEKEVGDLVHTAKATVGSGTLQCDGSSLLRTAYPDLYTAIGTTWGAVDGTHFSLPDFVTDNRFLRAAGGSLAVATTQTDQNLAHTHNVTGTLTAGTLAVDSGGAHTHTITDSGHTHTDTYNTFTAGSSFQQYTGGIGLTVNNSSTTTGSATTGISINSGGAHTHTVSGAPAVGTLTAASDGGTEARPNNAAVLICIKY